jgi:anti-sigma28 factor (negative regulator of flagellin synthesis)
MSFYDGIKSNDGLGGIDPRKIDGIHKENQIKGDQEQTPAVRQDISDKARISANATEIAHYQEMAKLHREAYGPVDRSEKLNDIKEKIQSGYYDKAEVIDALADKMTQVAAPSAVNQSDLQKKVDTGFYDRAEVIDKTAENMLNQVLGNYGKNR